LLEREAGEQAVSFGRRMLKVPEEVFVGITRLGLARKGNVGEAVGRRVLNKFSIMPYVSTPVIEAVGKSAFSC